VSAKKQSSAQAPAASVVEPAHKADIPEVPWHKYLPRKIGDRYEVHDFRHAACILANEFPRLLEEICEALEGFYFTDLECRTSGGNEGPMPKRIAALLRPNGWTEKQLHSNFSYTDPESGTEIVQASDTHRIDYCKGRVALDLEWNSKDQTFDRDLFAFRAFHEMGAVSVGVLITRSNDLDSLFESLGRSLKKDGKENPTETKSKFGASTTHMGKLLPRIRAGRGGGCPILVFGITQRCRR
jgi:hypothetical protein